MQPVVSVIIPTFNRPHLLRRALESCFAQTLTNIELIVVNDGGEEVEALLANLDAPPSIALRYVRHERNAGLAAARNTGLEAALGGYIAYLDDDDRFLPDHLERLSDAARAGPRGVYYSDYWKVRLPLPGQESPVQRELCPLPEFDYDRILEENFVPVLCILHPRDMVLQAGGFDEWLTALEDWDMWLRLSRHEQFFHVAAATCEVYLAADGSTITSSHAFGFAWAALNCLYKYELLLSDRPEAVSAYRDRARNALIHLKARLIEQLSSGEVKLSTIFGRHDLQTILSRLGHLQACYRRDGADFLELEALLRLVAGEIERSAELFEAAQLARRQ